MLYFIYFIHIFVIYLIIVFLKYMIHIHILVPIFVFNCPHIYCSYKKYWYFIKLKMFGLSSLSQKKELEPEGIVRRPKSTVLFPLRVLTEAPLCCILRQDHWVLRTCSGRFFTLSISQESSFSGHGWSSEQIQLLVKLRTVKQVFDSECDERSSPQQRDVGLTVAGQAGPVQKLDSGAVAAVPQDVQENKVSRPTEHHCTL